MTRITKPRRYSLSGESPIKVEARRRIEHQLQALADLFAPLDMATLEAIYDGAQQAVMEYVPTQVQREYDPREIAGVER